MKAVQKNCMGKSLAEFPEGSKTFITQQYNSVDVDGNLKNWQNFEIFEKKCTLLLSMEILVSPLVFKNRIFFPFFSPIFSSFIFGGFLGVSD